MDARPHLVQPLRRALKTALIAAIVAVTLPVLPGTAAAAVGLDPVAGAFDHPTYVTGHRGDGRRLFVVERSGTIRVVLDGKLLARPFLQVPNVFEAGEGGLLSMAFAPGYGKNRRFYVFYTKARSAGGGGVIRVDEFKRSTTTANRAVPTSQRRVLAIDHPGSTNHYGGQLQFGPDGFLYISTGDGGGANDPNGNAQNLSSLLGKLLRINPRPAGGRAYSVPWTNPFVGRAGRDEIFAYGLRNPYRFSFDQGGERALWIGDVGQARAEEVDVLSRSGGGANFGWNCYEGFSPTPGVDCPTEPPSYVPPVLEYLHANDPCDSITGGYVARSPNLASIQGRYVFGDYCRGQVWTATLDGSGTAQTEPLLQVPPFELSSFGEDGRGRLYMTHIGEGRVFELTDLPG